MSQREDARSAASVYDESRQGFAPDGAVVVRYSNPSNEKPYYLQRITNAWDVGLYYGAHLIMGETFATLEEAEARAAELTRA